jgi:DNA-binding NarL/FixJ family response regulator
MAIKIMLAFSNMLFSEGIKGLLANNNDFEVVDILKVGASPDKILESSKPDVILVDLITLYNAFPKTEGIDDWNVILMDTCCGEDNIISAVLTKRVSGVLLSEATPALFKKAIKAVSRGEVWLDKATVRNVITGVNSIKGKSGPKLSEQETRIVELVSQGLKNKEVAQRLHISEPTVKTHLHRIFQKLDINNRSQLITFALKNKFLL